MRESLGTYVEVLLLIALIAMTVSFHIAGNKCTVVEEPGTSHDWESVLDDIDS